MISLVLLALVLPVLHPLPQHMLGLHIGLRVLKLCFQDHANLLQVVVIVPPLLLDLHLQSFTLLVQSLELLELLLSESRDLLPLTFVLPLLLR